MATPNLPTVKFPWRMAIYGIAILYIGADMYVFNGPLSRMIDRMQGRGIEEQISKVPTGLVATVNTWPITVADLERGVWEYCMLHGLQADSLPPKQLEVIRAVVLADLIDRLAIWHFARVDPVDIDAGEVDAAVAQIRGHFANKTEFEERLAAQGMDPASFREHIADQVHQRAWLESKAAKFVTVSDAEARAWYEQDEDSRLIPERWRVRQVFMATLDRDPIQVRDKIAAVAAQIAAGEITFEQAALKHSQDDRTKSRGGDLGYFSATRMPEQFIAEIRKRQPGEASPAFRTDLGWHLVEVLEHHPAREADFEEVRAEIRARIESSKRREVIDQIVRDYRNRSKIWPAEPQPRAILGSS